MNLDFLSLDRFSPKVDTNNHGYPEAYMSPDSAGQYIHIEDGEKLRPWKWLPKILIRL